LPATAGRDMARPGDDYSLSLWERAGVRGF
jgi:hypothetical protein